MRIDVVICTWNRCRLLAPTLERLHEVEVPQNVDWQVIVIDNNCTTTQRRLFRALPDACRCAPYSNRARVCRTRGIGRLPRPRATISSGPTMTCSWIDAGWPRMRKRSSAGPLPHSSAGRSSHGSRARRRAGWPNTGARSQHSRCANSVTCRSRSTTRSSRMGRTVPSGRMCSAGKLVRIPRSAVAQASA